MVVSAMSEEMDKVAAEFFRLATDTLRDAKAVTSQEAPELFRQVVHKAYLENVIGGSIAVCGGLACTYLVRKAYQSYERDKYGGGDVAAVFSIIGATAGYVTGLTLLTQAYLIQAAPKAYLLEVFMGGR